jgi:hypothetical protein
VAAAHWLAAAAVVAGDASDNVPSGVFAEADDIQPVSIEVPTLVVERIVDDEETPREVVLELLRTAVAAGEGQIADLPGIVAERAQVEELVQQLPVEGREAALAAEPVRATLLDPRRPARDLLGHMLDGINACWLLYDEYSDDESADLDDEDDVSDAADNGDVGESEDDAVESYDAAADAQRRDDVAEEFADFVRGQAAARSQLI